MSYAGKSEKVWTTGVKSIPIMDNDAVLTEKEAIKYQRISKVTYLKKYIRHYYLGGPNVRI